MSAPNRHETLSLMTVLALCAAVVLMFPYSALSFRPSVQPLRPSSHAAFVVLSEKQERVALAAAKASWQGDASGVRRLRADLAIGELPEEGPRVVQNKRACAGVEMLSPIVFTAGICLPSQRAGAPERLKNAGGEEARPSAFSRAEMLRID